MSLFQTLVKRTTLGVLDTSVDPYLSSVNLLLGFNGADGSTSIIDESLDNRTITRFGNARINTQSQLFSTSSLIMNPTGTNTDYLTTPSSSVFNTGSGVIESSDVTMECWINPISYNPNSCAIFSKRIPGSNQGAWQIYFSAIGRLSFVGWGGVATGGNDVVAFGSNILAPIGEWTHVAVTRQGTVSGQGTWRVFVNGVSSSPGVENGFPPSNNTAPLYIGRDPNYSNRYFRGWIDEVRWTRGVARYTSNFTPPTAPFPRP